MYSLKRLQAIRLSAIQRTQASKLMAKREEVLIQRIRIMVKQEHLSNSLLDNLADLGINLKLRCEFKRLI